MQIPDCRVAASIRCKGGEKSKDERRMVLGEVLVDSLAACDADAGLQRFDFVEVGNARNFANGAPGVHADDQSQRKELDRPAH